MVNGLERQFGSPVAHTHVTDRCYIPTLEYLIDGGYITLCQDGYSTTEMGRREIASKRAAQDLGSGFSPIPVNYPLGPTTKKEKHDPFHEL